MIVELANVLGSGEDLPDFDAPPVIGIVGAVQFFRYPGSGCREMLLVGSRPDGYELEELQPQLPPERTMQTFLAKSSPNLQSCGVRGPIG
jgi:hypothetical protein